MPFTVLLDPPLDETPQISSDALAFNNIIVGQVLIEMLLAGIGR